ncbi:MAG: 5-amino-6-(D-ribitylamino)uracil--L-tyrosine 4-hydroxyphenyl transferase CofH [Burkholderiales bacterium]|nr:5-amino-6-(D-ribitylamino)uracil--L-tyrosine 4-hydroxyphenyl transferase CofH [Burkholderiales bacterium]
MEGKLPSDAQALELADCEDLALLTNTAAAVRDNARGDTISYSRKVFIPLTKLCRDSCHYCTFAQPPQRASNAYLTPDEVLAIARAGLAAECKEALFTLGDKPELRYHTAREELARLGHRTTLAYLAEMAGLVLAETGLLPHLNPGVMSLEDIERLRPVSASMGIMLESVANRLCMRGGPHFGSPDKLPAARLDTIEAAGRANVSFTSGILIGIGETRLERVQSLLALRNLHDRYGHLQEIIVQNFRAKRDTRMANATEPPFEDHLWTVAVARIIFGAEVSIQVPPNLSAGALSRLIDAGIDDWGGVSPVTIDHVNPEARWPHLASLEEETAAAGKVLVERTAVHPHHIVRANNWLDPEVRRHVLRATDSEGYGRSSDWTPGAAATPAGLESRRSLSHRLTPARKELNEVIARASDGQPLDELQVVRLFRARGDDYWRVCEAANGLRRQVTGDTVSYVVNRNINYTNICYFRCQFCAFSKGKLSENLRGRAYDLDVDEIARRSREAWARGATEVCLQGGIHPSYTGERYLEVLAAVKHAVPAIHVHAFSPLEIWQGAATLGLSLRQFLIRLKDTGLGSVPGTAAEVLDDQVRRIICPDKVDTREWLEVMRTAHEVGLKATVTIMFGHVDGPGHWARHLLRVRALQTRTGGFTEFVPLPFVPMQTPIYLKGRARNGATLRESVLMHAVARLALHPVLPNVQASWIKMGREGARLCLEAGANDLGGTLMDESISRAAGALHGQEMTPAELEAIAESIGRQPRQRTTLYADAPVERIRAAHADYERRRPAHRSTAQFGVVACRQRP